MKTVSKNTELCTICKALRHTYRVANTPSLIWKTVMLLCILVNFFTCIIKLNAEMPQNFVVLSLKIEKCPIVKIIIIIIQCRFFLIA